MKKHAQPGKKPCPAETARIGIRLSLAGHVFQSEFQYFTKPLFRKKNLKRDPIIHKSVIFEKKVSRVYFILC